MRLIDAEELESIIKPMAGMFNDEGFFIRYEAVLSAIEYASSVDAVPVVHAEWRGYNAENKEFLMDNGEPVFIVCSECACTVINNGSYVWNYCPKCVAVMDGKKVE